MPQAVFLPCSAKDFCYKKVTDLRVSYFDELGFDCHSLPVRCCIFCSARGIISVEAMQIFHLLHLHQISHYDGLNCIET